MSELGSLQNDNLPLIQVDLESFRTRIQELYVNEKRPLKEVMHILKKEGCNASRNMYLKKLKSWNLEKNRKLKDMIQKVTSQKVDSTKSGSVDGSGISTTAEITNYFKRRAYQYTGEEVLSLDPAATLNQPESLDLADKFFRSTYEVLHWRISMYLVEISEDPGQVYQPEAARAEFYYGLITGASMMRGPEAQVSGALIERGLRAASLALRKMDLNLFHDILLICVTMANNNLHELAKMFVKFMYQLSGHILGVHHAFTRVLRLLYHQGQEVDIFNLTFRGIRVAYDAISNTAGRNNTIDLWVRKVIAVTNPMALTSVSEICSQYEELIHDCDLYHPKHQGIVVRRNYAQYLWSTNRFPEATELLRQGGSILFQEPPSPDVSVIKAAVQSCYEWGEIIMQESPDLVQPKPSEGMAENQPSYQRRYLEAEQMLKATVEKSILLLGPQDHQSVMASQTLATFYKVHGHPNEGLWQQEFVLEQLSEFTLG